MSTIEQRIEDTLKRFKSFDAWEDRYRQLIHYGKKLNGIADTDKKDEMLVPGCLSKVWLDHKYEDGKITYYADSDAAITKGIIGVLVNIYSGASPEEVINTKPDFLQEIGITDHLSMNRRNGLANMCKLINAYAIQHLNK